MRVISWNIKGANKDSLVWDLLLKHKPDIILLQEVGDIPEKIKKIFDILSRTAIRKNGNPQRFNTAVLARGKIIEEIKLESSHKWVNDIVDE
ncbi:endonuclease/exonuclease/phosphatase family protein [Candidatus Woesearchaeota archaeon]|jgi:exonuclease III|nr:endonuclease/exonuclease/phosphatase family protein [Cryomorphaceae bacterium]MBT6995767.1 endonuclease/exonuclease/phosphatase family protein [Candidatus Woesearchaeota archaeon]MBT7237595.1 endonuclease/exonuclease/phosphatase family protein [Candidatus Woesearchaeota archaeon]